MEIKNPHWSTQTKLVVTLLLLALFIFLLSRFHVILAPFILAVILAYILTPAANFFQARLHIHRILATLLTYFFFLLALFIIPAIFIPLLEDQVTGLNIDFQVIIQRIETMTAHQYLIAGQVIDGQAVYHQIVVALQGIAQPFFGRTVVILMDVITSIVWLVFIAVVSFYLVKDSPKLHDWLTSLVPPAYLGVYNYLLEEINEIWSAFFRGQLLLALVVSILFTVAGLILGIPFWLAMAIFAGFLEFFPSIGHGIWLVTASLLALTFGSTWIPIPNFAFMLLIIALHLVYEQFDLNYLIPRIIGRSVHLPPLVVILGIGAGAVLAGVLGIALAAPTIASARVLGRYIYANLLDEDPFEEESVVPLLPPPNPRWWHTERSKTTTPREGD
jgi:predicted PurR-regulated permease PerM